MHRELQQINLLRFLFYYLYKLNSHFFSLKTQQMLRTLTLLFAGLAMAITATAADLPVTVVNGRQYYYYDVQPQETLFSLSQRLGISREAIIEYNPSVADGLKAYTRLYFPVESGHSTIADASRVSGEHVVKKGETLYGISKKCGISVDRLIELNPSARDGIKAGDVLRIESPASDEQGNTASVSTASRQHTIAEGETLYRIAADNGITVEDLLRANPDLDAFNYSSGTVITIPGKENKQQLAQETPINNQATQHTPVATPPARQSQPAQQTQPTQPIQTTEPTQPATNSDVAVSAPVAAADIEPENQQIAVSQNESDEALTIAVMLPFDLNAENIGKEAEMFTEFYRGFLLGAESLKSKGRKIEIRAYDTAGGDNVLDSLMSLPEMKQVNLFIGPENASGLNRMAKLADEDNQFILNNFVVRNSAHDSLPNIIQANIPHQAMYRRAIDAFLKELDGRTPVFVQRKSGAADKEEFTTMFKQRLDNDSIEHQVITYENVLDTESLSSLTADKSYVFIPISGRQSEFIKMAPALKQFNDSLATSGHSLGMFGYPEWLTLRGEQLENLGTLGAVIYSRFYADLDDKATLKFTEKYQETYGRSVSNAVPSQALMGYDTAIFTIKALRANGGDFHISTPEYDGLQTDFTLSDSDCEGLVNSSLLLIRFKEDGGTESHPI